MPPYAPNLDEGEDTGEIAAPEMMICNVQTTASGKKTLSLPDAIRNKWMDDPIRKTDWQTDVASFDARPPCMMGRIVTQSSCV